MDFTPFIIIIASYFVISFILFFLLNTNLIRRNVKYELSIPAELYYLDNPKLAVWVAKEATREKTVVLLHGFTRNSGRLNDRAELYWNKGYNVYLIDNLAHGLSQFVFFPSGIRYYIETKRAIEHFKIKHPIIHGVSMGAIAASYISQKTPDLAQLVICEALPAHFNTLYKDLMRYFHIPFYPFFWLGWLSKQIIWRKFSHLPLYANLDLEYLPWEAKIPMILIHSSVDTLFLPEQHFEVLEEKMKSNNQFVSWLVPDAAHSHMDENPQYEEKLFDFISKMYSKPV